MKTQNLSDINRRNGKIAWLRKDAAQSYENMKRSSVVKGGCVSDAGRTNAEQWKMWNDYLAGKLKATAAYPGTSLHETGIALDIAEPDRATIRKYGKYYGWSKDRVRNESWHVEYGHIKDRSKPAKIKLTRTLSVATYWAICRAVRRPAITKPGSAKTMLSFWRRVQRRINLIMRGQKGWVKLKVDGDPGAKTWEGLRLSLRVTNKIHRPGKNATRRRIIYCWQKALRAGANNKWSQKSKV